MEKPLSVSIRELKANISNIVNESNLPPDILVPIIKDLYMRLCDIAEERYEIELEQYKKSLKKENEIEKVEAEEVVSTKEKDLNE